MIKSISVAEHVYQAMKPYRIGLPILFSLIVGIATAFGVVALRSNFDYSLVRAISPHLSTLIETGDRTETMRLLSSVAKERDVDFVLVQNGEVVASTRRFGEMDETFVPLKPIIKFTHTEIDPVNLVNTAKVDRLGGTETNAQIFVFTPLHPLLWSSFYISLVFLALSLLVSQFYTRKVTKTMRGALLPIETMAAEITGLLDESSSNGFKLNGITELDRIQTSIFETKRSLSNATDKIAESKAKALAIQSYEHLFHDLYVPIASLTETVSGNEFTPNDHKRAVRLLSQQILNQISAATENLGNELTVLQNEDIRSCISEATDEALMAFGKRAQVKINQNLPAIPILVPHDAVKLKRAISNLVSNALKHSKNLVEVDLIKNDSDVVIRISDNGIGIKTEELTLVMNGRLRSKNGDRPAYGLPSANHITRLHGGRLIYGDSKLGGASFEIRI